MYIHPPRLWPLGLDAHTHLYACAHMAGRAHVSTQSAQKVWRALSPMVRHLAATVWFKECSQRQEGGRVLRVEGEGLSIWKNGKHCYSQYWQVNILYQSFQPDEYYNKRKQNVSILPMACVTGWHFIGDAYCKWLLPSFLCPQHSIYLF